MSRTASTERVVVEPGAEAYGVEYQEEQLRKYRERERNHWRIRVELAHRLFDRHAAPRFTEQRPLRVLDVGCSIGTFAVEFAKRGCLCVGVDYDQTAIDTARRLAREEGVEAAFSTADVFDAAREHGPFHVAVCFDIFEHLFDDQMGALLWQLRRALVPRGVVLFHTFPTQWEYLFHESGGRVGRGLAPFVELEADAFTRLTKAYAALHDAWLALNEGATHSEAIVERQHCNPTTPMRLGAIAQRAGFEILDMQLEDLYPFKEETRRRFKGQPAARRNLYGALAAPR